LRYAEEDENNNPERHFPGLQKFDAPRKLHDGDGGQQHAEDNAKIAGQDGV
jgi:hypothetical protein